TMGTLADFVRVSPEHESLVESALRDELQFVVVPSFDDALQAIDFLKTEGAGRATFLVISAEPPPLSDHADSASPVSVNNGGNGGNGSNGSNDGNGPHNGHADTQLGYQTFGSLLGLQPEFSEAFKFALPGLADARIVNDAGEAVTASISQNGNARTAM